MTEDKYLSLTEVAKHYRVGVGTVKRWCDMGYIPADAYIKVDRLYRFNLPKVEEALLEVSKVDNSVNQMELPLEEPENLDEGVDPRSYYHPQGEQ